MENTNFSNLQQKNATTKPKNQFWIYTIVVVVVAIIIFFIAYISPKNQQIPVTQPAGTLTDEQRQAILNQLSEQAKNTPPITQKQRETILKDLQKNQGNTAPLTDEQRQAILNSLNNENQSQ